MFSHIAYVSAPALDIDRAKAFWTETFGLPVALDRDIDRFGVRWMLLEIPGAATHLHLRQARVIEPSMSPALSLVVPDVDAVAARLRERGVPIITEPGEAEWNPAATRALFEDSEGNLILVTTP